MGPTIDIAICFDRGIESAALVLVASLRHHAAGGRAMRVHAVVSDVSPGVLATLDGMETAGFRVVLYAAGGDFGDLQTRGHISAGTYLRFLLPDLLPTCDRIVYLDVDMVVRRDVGALYDTPLEGAALAAVPDFSQINSNLTWRPWRIRYKNADFTFADYCRRILGVDVRSRRPYFNAGVLVMDLAQWRTRRLAAETLDFLRRHPDLRFLDQDALNHAVGQTYVPLDARWNAFAVHACPIRMHLLDRWTRDGRDWQTVRALWRDDPWIVHFAGPNKPWAPNDERTPLDGLWWNEAARVPGFDLMAAAPDRVAGTRGLATDKSVVA